VSDFDIAQVAEYAASSAKAAATAPESQVAPDAQLPEASSMVLFPALGVLGFLAFAFTGRRRVRRSPRLARR
jgi:hypothetical protein